MTKPYYQTKYGKLYHGDCREIISELDKSDLILTDPPYGIDLDTDYSKKKSTRIQGKKYNQLEGDKTLMDFSFLFNLSGKKIIFGANNFPQQIPFDPKKDGWICWDKRTNERADKILGSPFEMAVIIGQRTYKMIRMQHCGVKNADGDNSGRFHPTQKPVRLMMKLLEIFRPKTVLDPFLGSGTTALACEKLGIPWIGIELEKKYCDLAIKRLKPITQQSKLEIF